MKKLLIAAAVAGTMVSGTAFATDTHIGLDGLSPANISQAIKGEVTASTCKIETAGLTPEAVTVTSADQWTVADGAADATEIAYNFVCPGESNGKTHLTLTFGHDVVANVEDASKGLLKNKLSDSAAAKNVGIKLLKSDNGNLALNQPQDFPINFAEGNATGTNVKVAFKAKLARLDDTKAVGAGQVESVITAKVNYK